MLDSITKNVRYHIGKRKIEEQFYRWLSMSTTDQLINSLISKIQACDNISCPSPLFHPKLPSSILSSPQSKDSLTKLNSPPKSPVISKKSVSCFEKISEKDKEGSKIITSSPDAKSCTTVMIK